VSEQLQLWAAYAGAGAMASLLIAAAIMDVRTRIIPNWIPLTVFGLAAASWCARLDAVGLAASMGLAVLFLAAGFVLFSVRWIGGGDAKLIAAVVAWFGLEHFGVFVLMMTIAGAGLALAQHLARRFSGRGIGGMNSLPYGVAIAAGAVSVIPMALPSLG
jgi:prepilin peptidase CpaA